MKNILLPILLFAITCSYAQQTYTVTMNGIGPFKLNMKKSAVEKLLGKEIKIQKILKENWSYDTLS